MKILFISDIHGITDNLEYIKKLDENENFNKIVVLGDLYYNSSYDYETNILEVKEFLTNYKDRLICLRGNCDSEIDIKISNFPICEDLILLNINNIDIYCTHGNTYSVNKRDKFNKKGILIYGHYHTPYIEKIDDTVYICVGSISLPRNNTNPSYAIYENKKITIYSIYGGIINRINLL